MKKLDCIFLIDDNPADNAFHKIRIREADVCNTVKVATTGRAALEYLKNSGFPGEANDCPKPDLIFLDMNLPGVDGFEFLDEFQLLREQLKLKTVVIMLTTSLNPDDQKRAMSYKEVSNFLNKPLTVQLVKETVEKYF